MSFDLDDDEELDPEKSQADKHTKWLLKSFAIAGERRGVRYIEAKEQGYRWMLECRDMWDAYDEDAGLYFETYKTRAEVDAKVEKSSGDQKVMGIFDLSLPLNDQGVGVTSDDWEIGL